jgi:hypothetical protein
MALTTWLNKTVQPHAKALFNSPVTKLHVGSYTCRNRNGRADQPLSEHALANAIDISDFIFDSGERVAVVDSWPSDNPPLPVPNPTGPPAPQTPCGGYRSDYMIPKEHS